MTPTLLIIEEDPGLTTLLKLPLEADGYSVMTAQTLGEAEVVFPERAFDLAIVPDVRTVEHFKNVSEVPVIVIGSLAAQEAFQARKVGAAAYLHIPFDPQELLQVVRELLAKQKV